MTKSYEGDGNLEHIDPERLTIGNVLRMSYRGGGFTPFNDCVVLAIRVDVSASRQNKGLGKHISCETLAGALKAAKEGDWVIVVLGRPYMYADNPFLSMPAALVGYEKYEVFGNQIQDTHKVIVNSRGEYTQYLKGKILHKWEVVVGNVGKVYDDLSEEGAKATYKAYVDISKSGDGRAGGETVTLLRDDEIVEEHVGHNNI